MDISDDDHIEMDNLLFCSTPLYCSYCVRSRSLSNGAQARTHSVNYAVLDHRSTRQRDTEYTGTYCDCKPETE